MGRAAYRSLLRVVRPPIAADSGNAASAPGAAYSKSAMLGGIETFVRAAVLSASARTKDTFVGSDASKDENVPDDIAFLLDPS